MNRRQAAAALLLYRRQKHHRYWVHPVNQSHQQFGEFHTLYKDLRKYPGRFYTYYRISTEQFDYILVQIEHLIYKPTLTGSVVYLQKKNLQYVSGTYICYHLKALNMFTLMYLLSPTQKQYCAEIAMSKVLTDVFALFFVFMNL